MSANRIPPAGTDEDMIVLAAKSATALEVPAGALVTVIDIEGAQCADVVAFSAADRSEHFSQGWTRVNNWKLGVSTGDVLWSNRNRGLLTIVADSVGRHDLLFPCCSRYVYEHLFEGPAQDGCADLLAEALHGYGLDAGRMLDPLNVFMDTRIDADHGLRIATARSKAGDELTLRAEVDCIVGISACPDDRSACNGGVCTPIGIRLTAGG